MSDIQLGRFGLAIILAILMAVAAAMEIWWLAILQGSLLQITLALFIANSERFGDLNGR